jgi:hypothetical protein
MRQKLDSIFVAIALIAIFLLYLWPFSYGALGPALALVGTIVLIGWLSSR